jgi:hypothetical protein
MTPIEQKLQHFRYQHLPPHLQEASKPFCELAHAIATGGTSGPETTTALRKLLEAKDCYVRARLTERQEV